MDANAQSQPAGPVQVETVAPADVAALDATVRESDWPLIQRLWRCGAENETIYRLLRLRLEYCTGRRPEFGPHMDGFQPDARARFARWLVQQGRLNEGL